MLAVKKRLDDVPSERLRNKKQRGGVKHQREATQGQDRSLPASRVVPIRASVAAEETIEHKLPR